MPTLDVAIVYAKSEPMPADAWAKGSVPQEGPPKAVPAKTHEESNAEIMEDLFKENVRLCGELYEHAKAAAAAAEAAAEKARVSTREFGTQTYAENLPLYVRGLLHGERSMLYSDGCTQGDKVLHLTAECNDFRNMLMTNRRKARPCMRCFELDLLAMVPVNLSGPSSSSRNPVL